MKLRQGDRCVDISLNAGKYEDAKVAPMIFIALIENAFKHGNTGNTSDPIIIDIKADHDEVVCRTINKFNPSTRVDSAGGIGIANLRRRLQLIYDDKAQLSTQIEGDVYTSILRIPLL
jgi:LytS/YehU family sensor histidine kinase